MNLSQVAAILGLAAARDRRTVGEVDVRAWHEDIGDLDFDDARQAVSAHFRESTEYLMPVHVRRRAADIRRERLRIEREAEQRRQIASYAENAIDVRDRSAEVADMLATLRDRLGPSDPSVLRRTEWVREERLRQRAEATPNPLYQGPPPPGGWPIDTEESA